MTFSNVCLTIKRDTVMIMHERQTMNFKIGQVDILISSGGIRVQAPLADREILLTIDRAANERGFTQVSLAVWKRIGGGANA